MKLFPHLNRFDENKNECCKKGLELFSNIMKTYEFET